MKSIFTFLSLLLGWSTFAQVDLSPLFEKQIKAKAIYAIGFDQKIDDIKGETIIRGDFQNGFSAKKIDVRVKYKTKYSTTLFTNQLVIYGVFKDGKLEGSGGLAYFMSGAPAFRFIENLSTISTPDEVNLVNLADSNGNQQGFEIIHGEFHKNVLTSGYYLNCGEEINKSPFLTGPLPFSTTLSEHAITLHRHIYRNHLFRYKGKLSLRPEEGLVFDQVNFEVMSHGYGGDLELEWYTDFRSEKGKFYEFTFFPTEEPLTFDLAERRFRNNTWYPNHHDSTVFHRIVIDETGLCVDCGFEKIPPTKPFVREYGPKENNQYPPGIIVVYKRYGQLYYGYVNEILGDECVEITHFPLDRSQYSQPYDPDKIVSVNPGPFKAKVIYNPVVFCTSETCDIVEGTTMVVCDRCGGQGNWSEKYYQQGDEYTWDEVKYNTKNEGAYVVTTKTVTTKVGNYTGKTGYRIVICSQCEGHGCVPK